jgi:hypothetical protein
LTCTGNEDLLDVDDDLDLSNATIVEIDEAEVQQFDFD